MSEPRARGDTSPTEPSENPAGDSSVQPARAQGPVALTGAGSERYELIGELGSGGQGVVYKARDRVLGREVAMKTLPDHRGAKEDARLRFQREARAAAALHHPNIVQVFDVGTLSSKEGSVPYYTMELLQGEDMRQAIKEERLTLRDAVEVTRQVALALSCAHRSDILHRDVKPHNIFLRKPEPAVPGAPSDATVGAMGVHALLVDFGLAKLSEGVGLTKDLSALGTPEYMPPEQMVDAGRVDARADVYSLGATLYHALTGRPPFVGERPQVMYAVVREDPVRPRKLNSQIDLDLETICLKCIAKDARNRYQSAGDLAEDCRRYLAGEPIVARPVGLVGRLWRKAARNRRIVVPIAAVVIAALAWTAVIMSQGDRRKRLESEASRLLEQGRGPLEQAQVYLYHEGANYQEMRGQVEAGKKLIEQALAKTPDNALGQDLLGRAWTLLGEEEKAETCYREAIRIDPRFGGAHFHLGMLLLDRATLLKIRSSPLTLQMDEAAAASLVRLATPEFDAAAVASWTGEDNLSRALLPIARAYVAGQMEGVVRDAVQAASQFGDRPGCERFHVLAGLAQDGDAKLSALDRALRICPGDALASGLRGGVLLQKGDLDGAIASFDRAIVINPSYWIAFRSRGVAHAKKGDLDAAIADYEHVIATHPQDAGAFLCRGIAREFKSDHDGAIADYDKAIEINPRDPGPFSLRGHARSEKGDHDGALADYDKAIAACDQAIEINRQDAATFVSRGGAREMKGDHDGAIADYDRAIEIKPRDAGAFVGRGNAREAKGEHDGAISDFDQAIAINPQEEAPFFARGSARNAKGDHDGAIADLDRAIVINPQDTGAFVARGLASEAKGDHDGAIADFTKAIAINPHVAVAFSLRGVTRLSRGDMDGGLSDLDQVIVIDPRYPRAFSARGGAREMKGDHNGAIVDCTHALAIDPRDTLALSTRARVLDAKGDHDGAIADYTKSLVIKPRDVEALVGRGNAREAKGDHDGAIADNSEAIAINPRCAEAFLNRGLSRQRKNDLDGAIQDYTAALKINPGLADAFLKRGVARLSREAKDDFDGAIQDETEALKINPSLVEALAFRGLARGKKEDFDGAVEDLTKALEFAPANWSYREQFEGLLRAAREERLTAATSAVDAQFADGQQGIDSGKYSAARAAYEDGLHRLDDALASLAEDERRRFLAAGEVRAKLATAHYNLGCIYALRSVGKDDPKAEVKSINAQEAARLRDIAFQHLSKDIDLGESDPKHLSEDSDLAPLHDDPRWTELLKRLSK